MIFELRIVHNFTEGFYRQETRIWSGNDKEIEIRRIG